MVDANGAPILGVDLEWETSDSSVVTIARAPASPEQLTAGPSAVVTTHLSGSATIIARLNRPGFKSAELRVPVSVDQGNWKSRATVSVIDTAHIELTHADASFLAGATITWQTSDQSVLGVSGLNDAAFRAELAPRTRGSVLVTATVTGGRLGRAVLQLPITVSPLVVTEAAPWDTLLTVSDSRKLDVQVKDVSGRILSGIRKQWRSTNTLAFTVDDSGTVTALSAGSSELIATVGTPPLETSEHHGVIVVRALKVDATDWPDTMTVTQTKKVSVVVKDALNQVRPNSLVRWTSTNTAAFKVDATGMVTALSEGTGQLVASVGEGQFQVSEHRATITVLPLGVNTGGTTWPDSLTVTDTVQLTAGVITGGGAPQPTVQWSSTNTAVFTIDVTGTVIALTQGTGDVIARVGAQGFQTSERRQTIKVVPLRVVQSPPWPTLINLTNDTTLRVVVRDAFGITRAGRQVVWRSTNEAAFSVDPNGKVTPLKPGAGEVVASVGQPPFQTTELRGAMRVLSKWLSVSAGPSHTCGIAADRSGYCWGNNSSGELGNGSDRSVVARLPKAVGTFVEFDDLVAGGDSPAEAHSCGRAGTTTVLCWGATNSGQIGDGSGPCVPNTNGFASSCVRPLPVTVIEGGAFADTPTSLLSSVTAAGRASCVTMLLASVDVKVTCWGFVDANGTWRLARTGSFGVAGAADIPGSPGPGNLPFSTEPFQTNLNIAYVQQRSGSIGGGAFVCVGQFVTGGDPFFANIGCKGDNQFGELGDTIVVVPGDSLRMVRDSTGLLSFPARFGFASAGSRHACVIMQASGVPKCWGSNSSEQLGRATAPDNCGTPCSRRAIPVTLPEPVTQIVAGGDHTCAVAKAPAGSGKVYCWGANDYGQLGRGAAVGSAPFVVTGNLRFTSISAGKWHTCGITLDGAAYCWGRNDKGQLGDGTTGNQPTPVRVGEPPS